jgi:hypothetical protein
MALCGDADTHAIVIPLMLQVMTFDAFCQSVTHDMHTVLAMLSPNGNTSFGRLPLSPSTAPKPPVVAGLTVPIEEALEHMTAVSSPCIGLQSKTPGALVDTLHMAATLEAQHMAATLVAPKTHTPPRPSPTPPPPAAVAAAAMAPVAAVPAAASRSEELHVSLGNVPTASECAESYSCDPQQLQLQQQGWGVHRRRSTDLVFTGRHRRPLQHVNSRTNLLSAADARAML